ncbi:hypothetical protein [Polyangium spumosum]|uniref:Histidine kinase/HSP90-like ATPase domain-containing protein n=1 Tax=Polyangium spumosum TaxID=889282 RepID=A0A6N7Q3B8_9BACT|nr:hypothetical protein [Polyangium spumosum]MRG97706.1 hypothetical protein [Polyangium spumosum]
MTLTPTAFELSFQPNVELISIVRRFVSDFYDRMIEDRDTVSRMALATHELLENAVKYASDGATFLSITFEPGETTSTVSIRLVNRADAEHIAAVAAIFEEMSRHDDPFSHYQVAMARSAKRKVGSGLGLVRVRAEGEMTMSHTIEDDRVTILAQTTVRARRSS